MKAMILNKFVSLDEIEEPLVLVDIPMPEPGEGDRNDLTLQAASDHPDRFAVMGRLDLGDNLRSLQKLTQVDTTTNEDELKPDFPAPSATDVETEQTPAAEPASVVVPAVDN